MDAKTVYLNPGHDLKLDPGAVNSFNGLKEADVVCEIGKLVKKYLEDVGYIVFSRQSDNLGAIVDHANIIKANIFVSIHCNSFNTKAKGTETLLFGSSDNTAILARCIQDQVVSSLKTIDRGLKVRPDVYVLKYTEMPAVLVETAFIDNEDDMKLLVYKKDEFARAIARGITDYFAKMND